MTHKERLLSSRENTLIGYIGAAILGIIMTIGFQLMQSGETTSAFFLMLNYTIMLTVAELRCSLSNCKFSCELNEFWIAASAWSENKLKSFKI